MTRDLDDLRAALHGPPAGGRPVPIDEIMRKGRRLRTRRRLTGGTAWLSALAIVFGGGVTLWEKTSYSGTAPVESTGRARSTGIYGDIVRTGMRQPGGEIVLMLTDLPGTGMASVGCFGVADETMRSCRTLLDITDRTYGTGFHAVHASEEVPGEGQLPVFGYFDGPASKITVWADGRRKTAQVVTSTEDRDMKLFWFPLNQVSPTATLTGWAALDADGRSLPTGTVRPGVSHG